MKRKGKMELEERLVALRVGAHRIERELVSGNAIDFNIPEHGWGLWSNLQFLPPTYEDPLQTGLQSPEDDCMICHELVCNALAFSDLLKALGPLGLHTMREGGQVYWNMSGCIDEPTLERLHERLSGQSCPGTEK